MARRSALFGCLVAVGVSSLVLCAVVASAQTRREAWAPVTRLAPGTDILIETKDARTLKRQVGRIDEETMVTLNLSDPRLAGKEIRTLLLRVAHDWPASLESSGLYVYDAGTRVSPEGVFVRSEKVTDAIAVIEIVKRDEIRQIRRASTKRRIWGAGVGAGIGALAGIGAAISIAFSPCGGDCSDERAMMAVVGIGLPVSGGLIGYFIGKNSEGVYRAPVEVIHRAPAGESRSGAVTMIEIVPPHSLRWPVGYAFSKDDASSATRSCRPGSLADGASADDENCSMR